jgi:putative hydrolase of the HAD superfamily
MALGGLKVRAVLLDGLGTLVALQPPWEALADSLWRDYRVELSAGEARWAFAAEMHYYRAHHLEGHDAAGLQVLRQRCAEVLHASLPSRAAHALSLRQVKASMLDALRFSAYPDALSALPLLRARGIKLVVVSNWDVSLAPTLRGLGLGGLFDAVITSAQVGAAKPAPDVFRAALAFLGISAGDALHVGDDPRLDVLGARAAGVLPVLLRRAGEGAVEAPAGVATIASLAELPRLL